MAGAFDEGGGAELLDQAVGIAALGAWEAGIAFVGVGERGAIVAVDGRW